MIMQYLIDFQFLMLYVKQNQKNILLTELNWTMIDNYREAYKEIENVYRLHTETYVLRPFIDLHKFRTK